MQYPLYVHRDSDMTFRASFPDFPGADVTGNSLTELKRSAQDIVELRYNGSEQLPRAIRRSCVSWEWMTVKASGCSWTSICRE